MVFVCYISASSVTDRVGCKHCMGGVLVLVHPGTGVHMGRYGVQYIFFVSGSKMAHELDGL